MPAMTLKAKIAALFSVVALRATTVKGQAFNPLGLKVGICLLVLAFSGCINRPGMNLECRWPQESAFQIDLQNPADVQHLLADIAVADELTIRYRDEKGGRRPRQHFGIQFRTRASPRPSNAWAEDCRPSLIQAIVDHHGIRPAEIEAVRPRLGQRGLDLPVTIPVLLLYGVLASWALRRVRSRFAEDERVARSVALIVVSLAVAAAVVIAGGLLSGIVEVIRVGNEHLGNRADLIAWAARTRLVFVVSVVAFWILAFLTRQRVT